MTFVGSASSRWPSVVTRGLNHVKLVYQPGRPLEAKAYWGFAQRWSGAASRRGPQGHTDTIHSHLAPSRPGDGQRDQAVE